MKKAIPILYEFALWVIALLAIPKMVYNLVFYKKYRKSFFSRIGLKNQLVKIEGSPVIWIHAVSMGETKAASRLAIELKSRYPDCHLIISSVTETGHAEAKRSIPVANQHIYLPFDFYLIVNRLVKQISPDIVILCESDLWFNFLRSAKSQGAAIAMVNGKMSERSMNRFRRGSFFSKGLFDLFDLICVQNELYKERFTEAGVHPGKLRITGNLKFDEYYPMLSESQIGEWREKLGIKPSQLVVTIGSTHDPEELLFLKGFKKIWEKQDVKVLMVPRHPERFNTVAQVLKQEHVSYVRWSMIDQAKGDEKVILVDAMGVLRTCYQICDIAIVAGSFTDKVGGHNILEPCWYGKPVLYGMHMFTQLELVDIMQRYRAGEQVSELEWPAILEKWIEDPEERIKIGNRGRQLVIDLQGSTQRTLFALEPLTRFLDNE